MLASPGQSAILIPVVVEDGDVSGPVPVDLLKEIRKNDASLQCGEQYCVMPNGVAHPRNMAFESYPPVEKLMVPAGPVIEISLNAKSLAELAQGMGTDVVKLRVQTNEMGELTEAAPFVVTPHPSEAHVDGSMGALLPYRVARV
jgi:hypothetical protein